MHGLERLKRDSTSFWVVVSNGTLHVFTIHLQNVVKLPKYVSRFEKRDYFALIVDFEVVVLCKGIVDELFVALCFASLAASVAEIHSLKVHNYTQCIFV